MKIQQTIARKLKVTDVYGLDPISIYLEDFEPRKGKITISCYDKSWHSYWGGMGDSTISEFFLSCDNHYIAKNLSSISSSVPDYEKLRNTILEFYGDDIDLEIEEELSSLKGCQVDGDFWVQNNSKVLEEVFGFNWYYDIPTMENPKYKYLNRIIDAVKEALTKVENENHSLNCSSLSTKG